MTLMRVFYEDWQMECCGRTFSVGDEVGWRLVSVDEGEARGGCWYGAQAWVENHGGPKHRTVGRVRAIDLVHQEYAAHHDPRAAETADPPPGTVVFRATGRKLEPVPGSRTLEPVDSCPRWFDGFEYEEQPPRQVPFRVRRAAGALVTLEVPDDAEGPGRRAARTR
ncbi:DUF6578 domain-containing protein [Streptomyces cellostaticus]|uniref:DUF6578 domain-containing protein n=1 Tax=Streptomyces cellostaticus TaxID=67285 RepID=UPI0008319E07|nr:DUF6578 domain-containing protein [Streptomyces cellostaticus]GHI08186.1 hypothetical protein Scel_65070 [Streptomyces cellostaticus]